MQLTAPIINKSEEKRIVHGPVLVPGEKDRDGDVVDEETVEKVAYDYMENYRIIDADHSIQKVAVPVESYLLREEKNTEFVDEESVTLPVKTWMMSAKVKSDEQWQRVKDGELTGFSIMAVRADGNKTIKSDKAIKTTLEDLGDDFVVPAVSLVGEPAVPKGKYVAIKSKKAFDGLTISKEGIEEFCPDCAEKMEEKGLDEIKFREKQMPEEVLEGLCDSLGEEDGFFARCMDHHVTEDMEDPEAFCAWLHNYCHGKWPAEKKSANKELTEDDDAGKGLTDKTKEKITKFFSRLVGKEGRVISDENLTMLQEVVDRLEQAEEELNELLDVAYQERRDSEELTNFTFQEVNEDMDEEKLETIVKEVEEATDNISETYDELNEKIEKMEDDDADIDVEELAEEVADILKDDEPEDDDQEDDVEKGSDEEEDVEENEDGDDDKDKEELVKELKDKIEGQEDKIDNLKSKLNKSKALKEGEDDSKDKNKSDRGRDIFGRNN